MNHDLDSSLPKPIAALLEKIEQWRQKRVRRAPMPAQLWQEAIELAHTFGVYTISRSLNLNYARLKERFEQSIEEHHDQKRAALTPQQVLAAPETSATFVEIACGQEPGLRPSQQKEIEVELSRSDGSQMRLRLPMSDSLDLGAIISAFVGRDR